MRALLTTALVVFGLSSAVATDQPEAPGNKFLQREFDTTLAIAGSAVARYGVTDTAMALVREALARLAGQPMLRDNAKLQEIHGSPKSNAAVLATRGDDSVTLFLARFEKGHPTPLHDHQTWGIVYVLEGRDHYVHMTARFARDSAHADLQVDFDTVLTPGTSVYWLPPPRDLHTQEALDSVVWELVLAGRNLLGPSVMPHRHYFDPETGNVSHTPPK
ncbi:MAG TPA: hypothetical protein VNN55_05105 [bacterium]|nr:hypothetical protein [bacterium]